MFDLRVLGRVDLRGPDDVAVPSVLTQPKRLALLAYLAIAAPRGFHRRDTLLALFWPDLDHQHARNALSRAVYYLRRALGDEALESRGDDELGVSDTVVWCDAAAFTAALDAGQSEEALGLYQGELLGGFFIDGAPDFERWLEAGRRRLRERAVEAAIELARRAEAAGNLTLGVQWARRATTISAYDERGARKLIRLLDRTGDRAAAIDAYGALAQLLAHDLQVEPSPETKAVMEAVRSRRERLHAADAAELGSLTQTESSTAKPLREPPAASSAQSRALVRPPRAAARRPAGMAALIVLLATAAVALAIHPKATAPDPDPNVVVVLPFRVTGNASLAYLREGVVDLLATKLNGEGGPRAVDPEAVLSAWYRAAAASGGDLPQDAALALARRFHAGKLITGSVVRTADRLVLDAFLLDVPRGEHRTTATVEGPPDSVLTLIDRMTGQLLARGAGEEEERLASLTSTSLAALRPYLAGQAAYRRGAFREASRDFQRALMLDSTFALAAAGLIAAENWTGEPTLYAQAAAVLAAHRDRLSQRDRAILSITPGGIDPRNPPLAEDLAASERVVILAPDRAEAWDRLAELRFHAGSLLGASLRSAHARAAVEFAKAVDLDSGYAPALSHLVEYATEVRDASAARRFGARYLAADSSGDIADYVRWLVAVTRGDETELDRLRSHMPRMDAWNLLHIVGDGQLDGIGLDDVDRAAAELSGRAGSRPDLWQLFSALHNLALNRGRPRAALALSGSQRDFEPLPRETDRRLVLDALLGGGDSAAAREAADRLAIEADAPLAPSAAARALQDRDLCVLELWRLAHDHPGTASRAIARLRSSSVSRDTTRLAARNEVCATVLNAVLASTTGRGDRAAALARLDSLLLSGPVWSDFGYSFGQGSWGVLNLISARLHEEQGDLAGALAAARRRAYDWSSPIYLGSFLHEEGRLASLTGDLEGALHAYQHYLALRSEPEREVKAEVDQVRAAVAKLVSDRR